MKSHRASYPEQYTDPLCGKRVNVKTRTGHTASGVVERVMSSSFGRLAAFEDVNDQFWLVSDCTVVHDAQPTAKPEEGDL